MTGSIQSLTRISLYLVSMAYIFSINYWNGSECIPIQVNIGREVAELKVLRVSRVRVLRAALHQRVVLAGKKLLSHSKPHSWITQNRAILC